ncbi:kynurenine formamidase-like isoform X2 [Pomacea canaliculata]|nr:kynurenine formamidase-like isoform X2 [Pomacea canaliculata]XP_025114030.1 kynurenine formamidase-like isoform X2 [Pomacea canaliculata]
MGPAEVLHSHLKTVTDASREAQWCLAVESGISYGNSEKQKLDIYTQKNTSGAKKGVPFFVYIHGGYWQEKVMCRENSSFMAVPLVSEGATVVAVGYELCPDVSMDEIVKEVKQAMYYILKLAKEQGCSGIYLCGHSAGAHLAALMLMTSFSEYDAFDSDLIKGAILVSGIYDLRPLVKTSVNEALHLTEEDAWLFSPVHFMHDIKQHSSDRDILIAVGEYDPPEFRRQSGEFQKNLRDLGIRTRYLDIPDTDHFNVIEKLQQKSYILTKECIRLMKLSGH